jgi:excisionase family DNA binding protein
VAGSQRAWGVRYPVMEEQTYTTSEVARILGISPSRVRTLAANGELEAERDEAGHWAFPARALRAQMPDRPPRDTPDIMEGEAMGAEEERREANQGGGRPAPEAWIEKQVLLGVGTSGAWVSGELREVNDRGVTIRVRSEGQGEAAYVFYPWSNVQGIRKPDEEATKRRR